MQQQIRDDLLKQMQDLSAIVGILETTMIESADKVFGEKTLKLLAEEVFDELLLTI